MTGVSSEGASRACAPDPGRQLQRPLPNAWGVDTPRSQRGGPHVRRLGVVLCLLLAPPCGLAARATAGEGEKKPFETLSIPFPFYNDAFGFAAGYVYGRSGWPEPQSRGLGTVMGGTRGSAMLLFAGQDLRGERG